MTKAEEFRKTRGYACLFQISGLKYILYSAPAAVVRGLRRRAIGSHKGCMDCLEELAGCLAAGVEMFDDGGSVLFSLLWRINRSNELQLALGRPAILARSGRSDPRAR